MSHPGRHPPTLSTRKKLALVAILVVFTLALFAIVELGVRLIRPQELRTTFVDGLSLGIPDSLLGYTYRPHARAIVRGPEFSVEYRIGAEGLRDESPHPMPRPAGVIRVLFIGDSFTFGAGLDYEDLWTVVFERTLRERGYRVEAVRAGVEGYDTRTEVLYLSRLLPRYDPDVVVLAFLPNDVMTNTPLSRAAATDRPGGGDIQAAVHVGDEKLSRLQSGLLLRRMLMKNDRLYTRFYLMSRRGEFFTVPMSSRLAEHMHTTKDLLAAAAALCHQHSKTFMVVSIPQLFQLIVDARGGAPPDINVRFLDEDLAACAAENGFPWIPMLPVLSETYRRDGKDLYFRMDGHLNRLGSRVMGDALADDFVHRYATLTRVAESRTLE